MWDLERFVTAQAPVYDEVRAELRAGRKRGHWMWFIFPQLAGLGHSVMARQYALSGLDEARAFLDHPLLGARLRACSALALAAGQHASAHSIFGSPDDLKFHSCMTLFSLAAPGEAVFTDCIQCYYDGQPDPATASHMT